VIQTVLLADHHCMSANVGIVRKKEKEPIDHEVILANHELNLTTGLIAAREDDVLIVMLKAWAAVEIQRDRDEIDRRMKAREELLPSLHVTPAAPDHQHRHLKLLLWLPQRKRLYIQVVKKEKSKKNEGARIWW